MDPIQNITRLREIAAEADDITDPRCMDKILIYVEELQEEDEEFMQLLVDKFRDCTIDWLQPWYQEPTCLTRKLKNSEEESVEKFRTDAITKKENDRIEKNWRKLIKLYDIPDKLVSFARWKSKGKSRSPKTPEERTRQFVTAFLARKLKRNLYQVYKHVTTHLCGSNNSRKYSAIEEKIMEICFFHAPKHAGPYLFAVLGRQPRGINKRLIIENNGKPAKKKLKWSIPLATKLLKKLLEYTGDSLDDLKHKRFEKSVWLKLQDDFDQNYLYLQNFWYRTMHVQLFVKYDVKIKILRKKIFKIIRSSIYNREYTLWSDIRWKEIVKNFPDGFTHMFLYFAALAMAKNYPNYLRAPIEDVVDYAYNKTRKSRNRRLKTLSFNKDGMLEIVKYDVKMR